MEQIAEVKPHYVQVQLDFHVFGGTRASPETAKHNARIGHDGLARLLSFLEEHHTSGAKIFRRALVSGKYRGSVDWTFEAVPPGSDRQCSTRGRSHQGRSIRPISSPNPLASESSENPQTVRKPS